MIRMNVESGTYARKLAYDIGEVLGVGANMRELRRTRVGCFTEKEAVTLQDLKDAYTLYRDYGVEDLLRTYVKPVEYMVRHLPRSGLGTRRSMRYATAQRWQCPALLS